MNTRLMCLLVAVVAITTCSPGAQERGGESVAAAEGRPECPHDASPMFRSLQSETADVPEYNDCQRFTVRENGRLIHAGLFGIYAARDLDSLGNRLVDARNRGTFRAEAAAQIIAYDASYSPLGIVYSGTDSTLNCLFLWTDETEQWQAVMIPESKVTGGCLQLIENPDQLGEGTRLSAHADTLHGFEPSDRPAVARWDWDGTIHYIGINCGGRWCDVGPIGFSPPPPPHACPSDYPRKWCRTVRIKGWYDEQVLSVMEPGSDTLTPSAITGTIFPDSGLDDLSEYGTDWPTVAWVTLRVDTDHPDWREHLAKYESAYNLGMDDPDNPYDNPRNKLMMCNESWRKCGVDTTHVLNWKPRCNGSRWWAKIENTQSRVRYMCLVYRGGNQRVPGTVRWRWLLKDDGWWTRCLQGCCSDE